MFSLRIKLKFDTNNSKYLLLINKYLLNKENFTIFFQLPYAIDLCRTGIRVILAYNLLH